jgi:hypothetical protein
MYLAMSAAPIDMEENNKYDTLINKKRYHNRTQKRVFNSDKVNSLIESLQEDESNNLGEYKPLNPLDPPKIMREKQEGMTNLEKTMNNTVTVPEPIEDDNIALNTLKNAYMNDEEVKRYYNRLLANYQKSNDKNNEYIYSTNTNVSTNNNSNTNLCIDNKLLFDKLNYMINLLEEKKDERTNNVTEEVVLYSFLGIFIIFIVDSFARVGKYVR